MAPNQIDILKQMIRIRRFEQLLEILFNRGEIRGTLHLSEGHEAIAVGIGTALGKDDIVTTDHRPNHIFLGRGVPTKLLLAEILGKETGFNKGVAGNMHMFSKEYGLWGSNGIVAANVPISAGLALGKKMKNESGIVATVFGEGSTTEGPFHEAANMSALWDIPLLMICENNQYAQTTTVAAHSANTFFARKVEDMYKIKSMFVDGNDVEKVHTAVLEAKEYVTRMKKPMFIEMVSYRFSGHSINDKDQRYKKPNESEQWEKKDPIKQYFTKLLKANVITENTEQTIETEILQELNEALKFVGIS
jgi:pyruvate dehydrogenase E1 component alpha subunit